MRKDLITAGSALAVLVAFVVLLTGVTDRFFGRHGPFDSTSLEETWSAMDGSPVTSRSEVLTFRGDPLITVRAFDGSLPPDLRMPPMPDSLNRIAHSMAAGEAPPVIELQDIPGLDIELVRRDSQTGRVDLLVRITPEDAVAERAYLGDSTVTVDVLAQRWRTAVDGALRSVADSLAATARGGT